MISREAKGRTGELTEAGLLRPRSVILSVCSRAVFLLRPSLPHLMNADMCAVLSRMLEARLSKSAGEGSPM